MAFGIMGSLAIYATVNYVVKLLVKLLPSPLAHSEKSYATV
jgi:hypothetical protein